MADFLIGRDGQALQHVFEISVRFHAMPPTVFDQGVNDGATLARFFGAEEQPVLFLCTVPLSGVSAMVRPENVKNDLGVPRTVADTLPLN